MWTPVAGSHSIERVRLAITLKQPLAQKKVRELLSRFEHARGNLGFDPVAETTGAAIAFQFGPAGIIPVADQEASALTGWQAKRNLNPQFVAEALTLNSGSGPQSGASLIYENTEYTRWEVFLNRSERVLESIVHEFIGHGDLGTIFLEFYDRYNWVNDGHKAGRPSDFLPALKAALPNAAMEEGELWHLYRGWFELGQYGKLLINQNFDCQDIVTNNSSVRSIQILTRAEGRAGFWELEGNPLESHLSIMHERTKSVFAEVLSDEMQSKIGIV